MIEIRLSHGIVSAHYLHRVFLACQKLGARKPVLLKAMNIQEAELRNPQNRFAADILSELIHSTKTEVGAGNLYTRLSDAMLPSCFSDAGYSALFERSLEDALRAALIAQDLGVKKVPYFFKEHGNRLLLIWDDPMTSPEFLHLIMGNVLSISQSLVPMGVSLVKSVSFKHSKPIEFGENAGMSGDKPHVEYTFNRELNCIEFDRELIKSSNPKANSQVVYAASLRRIGFESWAIEPASFSKLCYNYLVYLLDKSGLSLDSAAESFSMAERTLRRKLVAEDESFRHILERVRRDACQLYFVEGGRSLSDIAAKLGYSELSAFTRAYTAWYGHPPSRDQSAQTDLAA